MAFIKKKKKLLASLACLVIVVVSLFGVAHSGLIAQMLRNEDLVSPSNFGLDYSSVSFPASDGLTIRGWLLETSIDAPIVIFLHGILANRATPSERVFGIAGQLVQNGYNILMFDFRAQGESGGKKITAGVDESDDLLSAIKYLREEGFGGKIGVLGFSMGAATALLTSAKTNEISAVVADSSYTDVLSIIKALFEKKNIPYILAPICIYGVKLFYGVDFGKISPLNALRQISIPVFVIHGGQDNTVPVEEAYQLREVIKNKKSEFWIVPEAEHADAYFARPQEYVNRLLSFLHDVLDTSSVASPNVIVGSVS